MGPVGQFAHRDPDFISNFNSQGVRGNSSARTRDDNRLNFKKGETFSRFFKGVHDLELKYGDSGAFLRGKHWYDFELKDESRPFYDIDDHGRQRAAKSSGAMFLDSFVYHNYNIDDLQGNVRLDKQVVSWGESTFIGNSISSINPIDVAALRRPEYKDKLTPGQMAMFQRYPDTYKIPVYKTQRTASSPQDIYAAVKSSALNTVAVKDGYGLQNFEKSHYTAFPIPKSGLEVVLNHLTRYRGTSFMQNLVQVTSQVNGSYTLVNVQQSVGFPWQMKDTDSQQSANVLFYAKKEVTSLARMAGNVLLVHEAIDQLKDPRMAWSYRRSTSCAAQPG